MTKKNRRPGQQLTVLKTALAVGSLAASLIGTQLLAGQETAAVPAATGPTPIVITVPVNASELNGRAQAGGGPVGQGSSSGVSLELPPIPQAITPVIQPVARTRSSR